MKLTAVTLADDSDNCNISELCTILKNNTDLLLRVFCAEHRDISLSHNVYLSGSLTKDTLVEKMVPINQNAFVCFWYGHGGNDSFEIGGEPIVTTTSNYYLFSNALVYTFSCFNGTTLADALIRNNALTFVGYTDVAQCPIGIDDTTADIAMTFISSFLSGKTAKESCMDLKIAYENAVFDETIDPFVRGYYQENRDALTLKGNKDLVLYDILVKEKVEE